MNASYEVLAGQVLIAGFPGKEPPERLVSLAASGGLGGIILFKRNLGKPSEVAELVGAFSSPIDRPMMVGIDQEGGRVERLKAPILELPPMRTLARTKNVELIREAAEHLGRQLGALGFTMDFAPVLDVDTNPANPVIGDRAFGSTAKDVERYAFAFAEGLEEARIGACGKHFPGHGDTDTDSHLDLPRLLHDRARLDAVELAPFRAAKGRLPALMSAHVVFDAIEPDVPATISRRAMTSLLRGELGWDGVTISDDLEMKAVADHYAIESLAVRAIEAGCDALLVCSDLAMLERAKEALARAARNEPYFRGRLEDANRRFLAMRKKYARRPILDETELEKALDPAGTAALAKKIAAAVAS